MAEERSSEPVHLEPFIHQVGGHSHMFSLDEITVCKPLITRELHFYESMPDQMKQFAPEYKGVIEVNFVEDADGYVTLVAYPPKSYERKLSVQRSESKSKRSRIRMRPSGSLEIEGEQKQPQVFEEAEPRGDEAAAGHVPHNPWLLRCDRNQLTQLAAGALGSGSSGGGSSGHCAAPPQKYILLENLTHKYQYPCVLDLKMGTRQYADDDSAAKQQRKKAKVATTTSSTLGVRINGMQVYQVNLSRFICRNKYYGRKLTVDGFKQALCQFIHNGTTLRTDLLPAMIARLSELRSVLQRQHSFRFFTSSLLVIYDGQEAMHDQPERSARGDVDVRMIDFAHATHQNFDDPVQHSGPDQGFIFGVESLISMLKTVLQEYG
ncbi:inositol hexakisphosphate kinase 1-like [Amphibalanus amphitrite]|uniref:inositol hexakisphosphate kinase 1-like n=1 Tax=Amphibalanus amphitrite TaxID=1232801 RepID=UPI001C900CC5|nr:inositol hexakisphosphate kinase 1-like [Amphibalanus amphitrite]XP_043244578.1 inositol hexakisphosphate kinase 1-like [Amphibalanus amphitrite]XP_043244579.1 inositol hexakisphosphate kinase 1-like [Amphibalanus amphitrite]XP_043244580.1 inositol hexakisphosphate kinase 1-like [Amphibalanus amphitrite]XP_043244581.1 inositol hexakisphosphate kinase 1-like [Amphibalanus amphitrite]XP_043244582.1 inositol hexakisphosphate kinase 1-like [Amphibalanus amphitrite]XP_043244583.1 inositol hexak